MSSYVSGLIKKNLKLKNITFMSPLTHTKLNMKNILSETQRIMKTSNDNNIQLENHYQRTSNLSNNKNKFISDFYKNYSSNRQNNYLSSYSTQRKNNNNIEKNNYIKKPISYLNNQLFNFSQFSSNIKSPNQSRKNLGISFTQSYSSKNYLRKENSNNSKNYRKRNKFDESEYLFSSSNNNSSSNLFKNSFNSQKYKFNNTKTDIKKRDNSTNSFSNEQLNTPISNSNTSSINKIKVIYNQIYTKINHQKSQSVIPINVFQKDNKIINANSINSNEQITSTQSSINKKITKSINSNISNENEINNIKNIDTPEELHFFYINILQNGKEVEGKFEVSSSINN